MNYFNRIVEDYCIDEIDDDSIELHSLSIVKSRIKTFFNLFSFVEMRTSDTTLKDVILKFSPNSNFRLVLLYENFWSKHRGLYVLRNLLIQFKLEAVGYQNIYVDSEYITNNKLRCIEYLFVRETFDFKSVTDKYFLEDFENSKYESTIN